MADEVDPGVLILEGLLDLGDPGGEGLDGDLSLLEGSLLQLLLVERVELLVCGSTRRRPGPSVLGGLGRTSTTGGEGEEQGEEDGDGQGFL